MPTPRPRTTTTALATAALALGSLGWAPAANDAHTVYEVSGTTQTYYGWAVSELADVDGDGVTDWVTGAVVDGPAADGRMEIRSGATGALLHERTGDELSYYGWAVADVGDVDGDGVHDAVVGGPGVEGVGYVEVVSGATGGLLLRMDSAEPEFFGGAVGDAGDVDGDGTPDVLVGVPFDADGGRTEVRSGATGAVLRTYVSPVPDGAFGSGTDSAGDLDGDGHVEHLVGAPGAGRAYVFDGADGHLVHTLEQAPGGEQFGRFFVSGVGDTDGDGVGDLYVGDYADDTTGEDAGSASVFSGADGSLLHRFTGAPGDGMGPGRAAGDVDGDGLVDLVVGSYTTSTAAPQAGSVTVFAGDSGDQLWRMDSLREGEGLGFDAVGLGDATGDGKVDLLVSAANADRVYLVRGTGARHTPG